MLAHAPIAPPEPELTAEDMIRRAQALRPLLRERQAECEALGRLPESTNDAFIAAGFYRILQPRRFGGYEFDVPTFVEVMTEVARGCPSSGWVLALTAGHTHTMTYLPEQAQVEAYGSSGEFRAPFAATTGVFAKPVEGGYVLNGGWDYSSGCDIATHFLGHVLAPPQKQGELPSILIALIERADYTIVDNWDVVGMRGTGSRRVVVSDLFVPAHRATASPLFTPGDVVSVHANPMYRGRPLSLLMMELACVSAGLGRAALDAYEEILRNKRVRGPLSPLRFESADYQRHFGHAASLVETANTALRQLARDYMAAAQRQSQGAGSFSDEEDHRNLIVEQQVAKLVHDAVTLMFQTGGSSAGKTGAPLERHMRDMSFIMTHMGLEPDPWRVSYARHHFGLPVALNQ